MLTMNAKEYINELRTEYNNGYDQGYADAWTEISKIVQTAAFESAIKANIKRRD